MNTKESSTGTHISSGVCVCDHDEPTDQDEFDGWRQLIDAAMNAPKGAGGK